MFNIVTRPTESITANSDPVGLQVTWRKGPPSGAGFEDEVMVGSLKAHVPFDESQARCLSSKDVPFDAMLAILPHFDHATCLQIVSTIHMT